MFKFGREKRNLDGDTADGLGKAERDVVTLGIAVAAILLFVGTGGTVMPRVVRSWMGLEAPPDMLLTNALLLNIALLIFGWRRYADLQREVVERRRAEHKARKLAETDPLTGCLNRRSGTPAFDKTIADAAESGREAAVLMVDLDNFKQINDHNGHQVGDAALVEIAERIKAALPAEGIVARIGGDEFACALPFDRGAHEQVDRLAEQLAKTVCAPFEHDDLRVEVTVSIGIAPSGERIDEDEVLTAEVLLHRADVAMYHAKSRGRNRHLWFEPQMESELRFRNQLETGIRRGLQNGEFVPYYEQQIDLETGELVGFEMLARWKSPQLGTVSPDIFIPIVEQMGLIGELSEVLIRQAFEDAKWWDPALTLAVNISPIQLRDPWFAQKLLRLLAESGFPASRLEIEITESCLHENIGMVRSMITSLKNQGIRISLDDFGTGYSSLAQLRSLPFDRLKIDRSFVGELRNPENDGELVQAIIALGRGLGLPITAEGIEDEQVLATLRGMGQLKGQGYLYGLPEDGTMTRTRLDQRQSSEPRPEEQQAEKLERKAG